MNAVNVGVIAFSEDVHIGVLQLYISVINDDELIAIDWAGSVWDLLKAACMTPKLTYERSMIGAPTKTNLYWKTSAKFMPVKSGSYAHFTSKVTLKHTSINSQS